MAKRQARKLTLTPAIVREQLSFARLPVIGATGKIEKFAPNTDEKRFVVFDNHREAPVGFGVAVNRTNMSYIIQRRVGARVLKTTLGNVRDISLDQARVAAREALVGMRETGKTPAQVQTARKGDIRVADMTVEACVAMFRRYLVERAQPAKESSLVGVASAIRRVGRPDVDIAAKRIGELIGETQILAAFDAVATSRRKLAPGTTLAKADAQAFERPTRTTAELTFRWISRAVDYCMTREKRVANNAGRPVSLLTNPFHVLREEGRYRSRKQLEEHYEASGARNPMQLRDGSLGRFLDALWERRKIANYRTACDFLLLTLLWGTRRGEGAPLRWRSRLSKGDAAVASWVDLETGWVSFFDTKNGTTHTLPLAPAARRILTLRFEEAKDGIDWVFPARSSRAVQGHYLDSKAILQGLRKAGEIEELRTHDLRRTFATVAEEITSYAVVKRLMNHRDLRDMTGRYSKVGDERLLEEMIRVEAAILSVAAKPMRVALLTRVN